MNGSTHRRTSLIAAAVARRGARDRQHRRGRRPVAASRRITRARHPERGGRLGAGLADDGSRGRRLHGHPQQPAPVDDALVAVTSPAAAVVELHETVPDPSTGMMAMQPVVSVPVPAGGMAELKPGGYHVMLIDLVAPLTEGTTIDLSSRSRAAPS